MLNFDPPPFWPHLTPGDHGLNKRESKYTHDAGDALAFINNFHVTLF